MAAVGGDGVVAPQPAPLLSVFHELNPNEMLAKNSSKVRN